MRRASWPAVGGRRHALCRRPPCSAAVPRIRHSEGGQRPGPPMGHRYERLRRRVPYGPDGSLKFEEYATTTEPECSCPVPATGSWMCGSRSAACPDSGAGCRWGPKQDVDARRAPPFWSRTGPAALPCGAWAPGSRDRLCRESAGSATASTGPVGTRASPRPCGPRTPAGSPTHRRPDRPRHPFPHGLYGQAGAGARPLRRT